MNSIDSFFQEFQNLESSGLLIKFIQFCAWILVIMLITWLLRKVLNKSVKDNMMRYRAKKVVLILSYIIIIIIAILTFTGNVQYFTLAIGLISAGLAFALQEVILSVAGWVAIFTADIYKTGDRIELNGIKGDVIDIGITRTTLMEIGQWVKSDNYSGRIVQVSNAFVFKGPVHNYSSDFPFVWDEIDLPIRYGSDLQLAEQIITDAANAQLIDYAKYAEKYWSKMVEKFMIENANVSPTIRLNLTDNWVEFNLRFVIDYKNRRVTKDKLYKQIHDAIRATNGKVELGSATSEITALPNLNVILENKQEL